MFDIEDTAGARKHLCLRNVLVANSAKRKAEKEKERWSQGVDQVPEEVAVPGPAEVGGGRQEGQDRGDQEGARHPGGLPQAGQEGSHGHTLTGRVGGQHSLS